MQASVAHTQTPLQTGYEMPKAGFLLSSSLPHCGQIGGSVSATCTLSGSMANAPQFVSLAPSDHQTQLCDSVRPASFQVQGRPLHFSEGCRCPCLACRDRSPTGEGCDRAPPADMKTGFYSPYFFVPKKSIGL